MEDRREKDKFEKNKYKYQQVNSGKIGHDKDGFLHLNKKDLHKINTSGTNLSSGHKTKGKSFKGKSFKGNKKFKQGNKSKKWLCMCLQISFEHMRQGVGFPNVHGWHFFLDWHKKVTFFAIVQLLDLGGMCSMIEIDAVLPDQHLPSVSATGKHKLFGSRVVGLDFA